MTTNLITKTSGTTTIPSTSDTLLQGAVSSILGLRGTEATDTAAAAASTTQAEGYTAEGEAYKTVEEIANQNAAIAGVSGAVQQIQQERALGIVVGGQEADTAASGFGSAGSNLDIMRSTLQQGYLTQQLTATQTALTKGGYLEEAAASKQEQAATKRTADAATAAAAGYTSAAALAKANAANETAALNDFVGTNTLTTAQSTILAPLKADITKPLTWGTGTTLGKTPTMKGLLPSNFKAT